MASNNSVFGTLRSITAAKQGELQKQTTNFSNLKRNLLQGLEGKDDPRERIELLVERSESWQRLEENEDEKNAPGDLLAGSKTRQGTKPSRRPQVESGTGYNEIFNLSGVDPANLRRLMDQSRYDSAVPMAALEEYEEKLKHALDVLENKYAYANLFNQLVTERSQPNPSVPMTPSSQTDYVLDDVVDPPQSGRDEMQVQKKVWEGYTLSPNEIDIDRFRNSLKEIFDDRETKQIKDESLETASLKRLRKGMLQFCRDMQKPDQFNNSTMPWVVEGLLEKDLLSPEHANVLKEIQNDDTYLKEMSDVLNMRIASLDTWSWTEAVPLEMRRQLNGKYRVYMQEDIADALLIHYIGVKFAVWFKDSLWNLCIAHTQSHPDKGERERRRYFLNENNKSISSALQSQFGDDYFLSQLPTEETDDNRGYGEDDLAQEADQMKQNPLAVKQSLLHLIYADGMVQNQLDREVVVLQTDFKWFGPSLSHDAIFTSLEFFGVTKYWIEFFQKFLEVPMRFVNDGPLGAVRVRKRGVPMSHVLSDLFGEVVMFVLDHAVEKATGGIKLWRLHDDVLFWSEEKACLQAWATIQRFCSDAGLEINMDKTGVARLNTADKNLQALDSKLPLKNPPVWGFTFLDPKTGRLRIDRSHLDIHVPEFQHQLSATTSVFGWIQAYNAYVQFVLNNLLHPAPCFGLSHLTESLDFLKEFHAALFPEHGGSPAKALKARIERTFAVPSATIPSGFLYLPLQLGGLELRNPFISLHAYHSSMPAYPTSWIDKAITKDVHVYQTKKKAFEQIGPAKNRKHAFFPEDELPKEFLPWDEYEKFRYDLSPYMLEAWNRLRKPAEEENTNVTPEVSAALQKLPEGLAGIRREWRNMPKYWRAITNLYISDMKLAFGGLEVVERNLLPMGMVGLWKGGKVRWEG